MEVGNVLHHVKNKGGIVRDGRMSVEYVRGEYIQGKCSDPARLTYYKLLKKQSGEK